MNRAVFRASRKSESGSPNSSPEVHAKRFKISGGKASSFGSSVSNGNEIVNLEYSEQIALLYTEAECAYSDVGKGQRSAS